MSTQGKELTTAGKPGWLSLCRVMEVNILLTHASVPGGPLHPHEIGPVATMATEDKELTLTIACAPELDPPVTKAPHDSNEAWTRHMYILMLTLDSDSCAIVLAENTHTHQGALPCHLEGVG